MSHKKIKTQPCLSPESPFMRKPSKQFLQKISFNKNKNRDLQKDQKQFLGYNPQNEINKISFISTNSVSNLRNFKNEDNKLKKTTFDLNTFKIKHENLTIKTQFQEIKRKNNELQKQNSQLKQQILKLKTQIEGLSRSKISTQTQQRSLIESKQKQIQSQKDNFQQILQINSYNILPTTLQVSQVNSITFDDAIQNFKSQLGFGNKYDEKTKTIGGLLYSSLNKKISRQTKNNQKQLKQIYQNSQIQNLRQKIIFLENQLKNSMQKQKHLQNQNQSLRLCASMSKRKLYDKDTELKEIKIKEKKKKFFEKLFQLSSEEDIQNI